MSASVENVALWGLYFRAIYSNLLILSHLCQIWRYYQHVQKYFIHENGMINSMALCFWQQMKNVGSKRIEIMTSLLMLSIATHNSAIILLNLNDGLICFSLNPALHFIIEINWLHLCLQISRLFEELSIPIVGFLVILQCHFYLPSSFFLWIVIYNSYYAYHLEGIGIWFQSAMLGKSRNKDVIWDTSFTSLANEFSFVNWRKDQLVWI